MSIVPVLKSKEIIRLLIRAGFRTVRQSGSHVRMRHISDPSRQTTVPLHNTDIPRWLLQQILKQAKITVKDLLKFLERK